MFINIFVEVLSTIEINYDLFIVFSFIFDLSYIWVLRTGALDWNY